MPSLPWSLPGGLTDKQDRVGPRDGIPVRPLVIGQAKALADLTKEYVFFTPAALYLARTIPQGPTGPWYDFCAQYGTDIPFYQYRFQVPMFAGMETSTGERSWNHVLWAVPVRHKGIFLSFAASLAFLHPDGAFDQVYLQKLTVLDPLTAQYQLRAGKLEAWVLTLGGTKRSCACVRQLLDRRWLLGWMGPNSLAEKARLAVLEGKSPKDVENSDG